MRNRKGSLTPEGIFHAAYLQQEVGGGGHKIWKTWFIKYSREVCGTAICAGQLGYEQGRGCKCKVKEFV